MAASMESISLFYFAVLFLCTRKGFFARKNKDVAAGIGNIEVLRLESTRLRVN